MKDQPKKQKKSISTSKKVALAVLGALTLLTFVNIIQAAVNRHRTHDVALHIDRNIEKHVEEALQAAERVIIRIEEKHNRIKHEGHVAGHDDGELVLEESYEVNAGENLSVAVGDADIEVNTNGSNDAIIEVYLHGKDMELAQEYFENQNFDISRDGETIHVVTRPVKKNYSWRRHGGAHIKVKIQIPDEFNVNLKTSDGDIALGNLNGEVSLHSSDGDIAAATLSGSLVHIRTSDGDIAASDMEAGKVTVSTSDGDIALKDILSGEISVRTSDGDIKAAVLTGNASVNTSDGDIVIKSLEGDEVSVRSSDGEIIVHEVQAGNSHFQTSDGSIMLKNVSGKLTAKTSSGDLNVTLNEGGKVYLRTGDGDIHIRAPQDYAAELFLKGERVRVSSGFQFDGKLKENEAEGRINGGGLSIEARTSDGEVVFREN